MIASSTPDTSNRLSGSTRVTLFTLVIAAAAVLVGVLVADWPALPDAPNVPWWLVIPAAYLSELTVVHFRGRRDAHSFSMNEIPMVFGLYFVAPGGLMLAVAIGTALVLAIQRRQPTIKLLFNVAQLTLVFGLAVVVFRFILGASDPITWLGWMAALAATMTALLVGSTLVNTAIVLMSGSIERRSFVEVMVLSVFATVMSSSLALIGVTMIQLAPEMALLSVVPPIALFLAYRAYMTQREQRTRLEALYEATRILHETPEISEATTVASERAQIMFDAEYAEITLFADNPHDAGYRTRVGPGDERLNLAPVILEAERQIWDQVVNERATKIFETNVDEVERTGDNPPIHQGIATPLLVDDEVRGILLVANKLDDISTYKERDTRLLETFARQVSVSLENGKLVDSLASLTELKEELRHQALHDPLTGLSNRTHFTQEVENALSGKTNQGSVAAMFIDLDDFKGINDSMGHAAGDTLLCAVSDRLLEVTRSSDTVARIGGDEFAILIPSYDRSKSAELLARRIIEALDLPVMVDGRQVFARASIGIAYAGSADGPRQLLSNADTAMYATKQQGKGSYRIYEPSMHDQVSRTLELRDSLQTAMRDERMELQYQPIVDTNTGQITSFEALIRWNHPERGVIQPNEFIPFAEESGLILPLGRWALIQACSDARRWQDAHPDSQVGVAVNLSPKQLHEADIVEQVAAALDETGLDPDRLTLEITENVVMHTAVHRLEQLKALGVHLAIDDFGTGYSSLSYLDRLPIDIVKVDGSFVARLGEGETSLVRTVLTIGNSLHLGSVIEGVETKDQLVRLRKLGCRHVQGFYLSPPVPIDQAIDLTPRKLMEPLTDEATVTQIHAG